MLEPPAYFPAPFSGGLKSAVGPMSYLPTCTPLKQY